MEVKHARLLVSMVTDRVHQKRVGLVLEEAMQALLKLAMETRRPTGSQLSVEYLTGVSICSGSKLSMSLTRLMLSVITAYMLARSIGDRSHLIEDPSSTCDATRRFSSCPRLAS